MKHKSIKKYYTRFQYKAKLVVMLKRKTFVKIKGLKTLQGFSDVVRTAKHA